MQSMTAPKLPSERSFGFLFAAVLAAVAAHSVYKQRDTFLIAFAATASAVLLIVALASPKTLAPLNKAWFRLGILLGRIVSPIVVGIFFFCLVTPVAVVTRFLGRDELRLKRQRGGSYWVERLPPGPSSDSFKNQF
jgi:predicted membrane metal-binding protein